MTTALPAPAAPPRVSRRALGLIVAAAGLAAAAVTLALSLGAPTPEYVEVVYPGVGDNLFWVDFVHAAEDALSPGSPPTMSVDGMDFSIPMGDRRVVFRRLTRVGTAETEAELSARLTAGRTRAIYAWCNSDHARRLADLLRHKRGADAPLFFFSASESTLREASTSPPLAAPAVPILRLNDDQAKAVCEAVHGITKGEAHVTWAVVRAANNPFADDLAQRFWDELRRRFGDRQDSEVTRNRPGYFDMVATPANSGATDEEADLGERVKRVLCKGQGTLILGLPTLAATTQRIENAIHDAKGGCDKESGESTLGRLIILCGDNFSVADTLTDPPARKALLRAARYVVYAQVRPLVGEELQRYRQKHRIVSPSPDSYYLNRLGLGKLAKACGWGALPPAPADELPPGVCIFSRQQSDAIVGRFAPEESLTAAGEGQEFRFEAPKKQLGALPGATP